MADIVALGELLIDFVSTESGVALADAPAFQKAVGGAPANVVAGVARLGGRAAFIGKVGDDPFGHHCVDVLAALGVETRGIRFDPTTRTMLAFVSLREDGERDFVFFRHPSADMHYRPDEVDAGLVESARIFHVGSLTLGVEPVRSATLYALEIAERSGALISYDPNYRPSLWPRPDVARAAILELWPRAHIIKVGEEELSFLSQRATLHDGVAALWHDRLKLLAVTRGAGGVTAFTADQRVEVPGFTVPTVDTTGAGDAFHAGLLLGLLRDPTALQGTDSLTALCRYANAVGALTTTMRGAIPALPDADAVARFLATATEQHDQR